MPPTCARPRHVDGVLGIDFRRPGPSLLATDPFSVVRTDPGRPSSSSALILRAPQQDAHLAASKQREGQQQQIESQLPVPSQPSQVPPTCGSCALTPAAFPNLWLPRTSHALVPDRASLEDRHLTCVDISGPSATTTTSASTSRTNHDELIPSISNWSF
ncbi:hypothetical protein HBI56_229520 [Parastagonospora nodorum]|uniref:Uncharacterized protein n=1 Tax=Phaeosphaeria nodorum (strain SN15 / ATCC MYA-4574 / FGSC 10173) TaxID=321614 RepID=Q0UFR4_PHANO|nr:hypothetical protein SNOG_09400 [Parastagonospora nodorum SN15]KAH3906670.1 hypothetical protein HBH56_201600 [Parastagonospora nodorum]EAT83592.1 hypothetical protein SNOG_09400 [Parastagonospora nodorum SN15]KAH3925845.1 hypothetical protein HBH54_174690 [Parastagonospora nodorum]KAH3976313.1 hypothetical protein HBH52_122600 [Parastagonospora nodorum]KAH4036845.1 hypothetical protein HBI09_078160 [Parastagonospora nodorum]